MTTLTESRPAADPSPIAMQPRPLTAGPMQPSASLSERLGARTDRSRNPAHSDDEELQHVAVLGYN